MNITRRIAIRNLLIVTAGAAFLPSCFQGKVSIDLKNLDINADHENILASLTETIIPKTDTPGAKDVAAHLFTLKMVDDCYNKEEQKNFMLGFEEFNKMIERKYSTPFNKLDSQQQEEILSQLEKGTDIPEVIKSFYLSARSLTVLCYTTSEYYLKEVKKYSMIPGKYQGSVLVTDLKASV